MKNNNHKVYGMLLEIGDMFFLSIQYALSLEEAFHQAKLEFIRLNRPKKDLADFVLDAKIGLFVFKDLMEMVKEHKNKIPNNNKLEKTILKHIEAEKKEIKVHPQKKIEIKKVELTKEQIKNTIMKEIILKKDNVLLETHKKLFNKNERQYLTDKINSKIK